MLYLGIDQHARQLTISLRDDSGDVLQARQVSTQPEKIQAFFAKLTRDRAVGGGLAAAVGSPIQKALWPANHANDREYNSAKW